MFGIAKVRILIVITCARCGMLFFCRNIEHSMKHIYFELIGFEEKKYYIRKQSLGRIARMFIFG